MLVDGQFRVAAPPEQVLRHLFDARLMASCLPGCESLEAIDDDRYRAVVAIALAGIKARFDLLVEVTGREADGIRAVTRGEEGGNASTLQATSDVRLTPADGGTTVDYRSEVEVTGRLGRFALGMMKKKAQSLGEEFAANLQARLAPEGAAAPTAVAATPSPASPAAESSPASPAAELSPAPVAGGSSASTAATVPLASTAVASPASPAAPASTAADAATATRASSVPSAPSASPAAAASRPSAPDASAPRAAQDDVRSARAAAPTPWQRFTAWLRRTFSHHATTPRRPH